MKKLILSVTMVMGLTAISIAQTPATAQPQTMSKKEARQLLPPEQRAAEDAEWAQKKLGLTAEQRSSWQAAALKRMQANQPLRDQMKSATITPEQKKVIRGQVKANESTFETAIAGFLTPEQKAQFDQHKKEKRAAHKQKIQAGKASVDDIDDSTH